jgi:integrase
MATKKPNTANKKKRAKDDWPKIRPLIGKSGKVTYMVDTCGRLPKRERPVFKTLKEAEVACEQYRAQLKGQGTSHFELSNVEREDAVKALEKCRELGFRTLEEAIAKLATFIDPPAGEIYLGELREQFLAYYKEKVDKGNRSARQLDTIRQRSAALLLLFGEDKPVTELSPRRVWDAIHAKAQAPDPSKPEMKWKPRTIARYCTVLGQMFDFAVNKKYLVNNPLKDEDIQFEMQTALEPEAQKAPLLLLPEQAAGLLRVAYEQDGQRGLLAYTAICIFTGARPQAEVAKLEWEDIEMDELLVHIRSDKSKNDSSQRSIPICPALMEWLRLCERSKPLVPKYPVKHYQNPSLAAKTSKYNPLEAHWKKIRAEAGIPKVIDLTRHSYASYSYALNLDKNRLQHELGHSTAKMLKHYLEVSTGRKKVAARYFDLTPAKVLGEMDNVIRLGAVG